MNKKKSSNNKKNKYNSKKTTELKEKQDEKNSESNSELSLNINWNSIKKFLPIFLILFIIGFAFYVRSGPITLNGLDSRIQANAYGQIKMMISHDISQKYKNLGPVYKDELVNKEFQKVLNSGVYERNGQKVIISNLVKQNEEYVKNAFKANNGQTYLEAIDPYFWLRKSTNLALTGTIGDKIINGTGYETLQLAPSVRKEPKPNFQEYLEAFLFKLNGVTKNTSFGQKTRIIFLIPVVLAMLSVIPIYLILRKYTNDLFASLGSIFLVSIGTFVSRTIAGFVDTDGYVVLFPLIIVSFMVYAFYSKNKLKNIILTFLAGFFQGLFLLAWSAGWFIFAFIILAIIGYILLTIVIEFLKQRKIKKSSTKFKKIHLKFINEFISSLVFLISSFIFGYVFIGRNIFTITLNGILASQHSIASISFTNIWPNVYSSVAELNPASFSQVISSVGGKIVFLIAFFGLLLLSFDINSDKKKYDTYKKILILISTLYFALIIIEDYFFFLLANHQFLFLIVLFLPIILGVIYNIINLNYSEKLFFTILLSIWMAGTLYMSLNGVRFILLLSPVFSISFGIGLFYLAKILNNFFTKEFSIKNDFYKIAWGFGITSLFFLILFVPVASQAISISNGSTPNFDDAWYTGMNKITQNSNPDAIITSWWDFGHFFSAISHRGVTFDGGSQTTPRAYWVGKLLMEDNDTKSVDILRMLVCGGNEAFNTFMSYTNGSNADAVKISKVLDSTLGKPLNETRKILEHNKYYTLNKKQVDKIMNYLACKHPREDFLITSGDMVGKAGVWAHWGSWDFTKKYVRDHYKTLSPEQIAKNIDENVSLIRKYVKQLKEIDVKANTENIKKDSLVNRWLAPYPTYIPIQGRYDFPCTKTGEVLSCQNGISVNMLTGKVTTRFRDISFHNLYYPSRNDTISKVKLGNGKVDLLLIPNYNQYSIMMMQKPLGDSLFTKLFYLNGYGTKHFKLFYANQSMTGDKIKIWKVIWDINKTKGTGNINLSKSIKTNSTIEKNSSKFSNISVGNVSFLNSSNATNKKQ